MTQAETTLTQLTQLMHEASTMQDPHAVDEALIKVARITKFIEDDPTGLVRIGWTESMMDVAVAFEDIGYDLVISLEDGEDAELAWNQFTDSLGWALRG